MSLTQTLRILWAVATGVLIGLALMKKLGAKLRTARWTKVRELFEILLTARLKDSLALFLFRLPMHLALNTSLFFLAPAFGVHVPFLKVIASLSIVTLVGSIPITPGGLGTIQVVTLSLFEKDVQGPLLLSMSLAFLIANYLLKALTGALFFRKVLESPREKP